MSFSSSRVATTAVGSSSGVSPLAISVVPSALAVTDCIIGARFSWPVFMEMNRIRSFNCLSTVVEFAIQVKYVDSRGGYT